MARSRVRETVSDIEAQLLNAARGLRELADGTAEEAAKVKEAWQANARAGLGKYQTGDYVGSINVRRLRRDSVEGFPRFRVEADDYKAHWIEYGTESDPEGTQSKLGPNTPTPEFAFARRTAAMFGGTIAPSDKKADE